MKYKVTLASYVTTHGEVDRSLGPVPGTSFERILDPEEGDGREIYWGYLRMREEQKKESTKTRRRILLTERDPEIKKFREALNLFLVFVGGGGRDNYVQVQSIEPLSEKDPKPDPVITQNRKKSKVLVRETRG